MEPRIQYAKTSDGVSVAFWKGGQGPALIWMSPFPFSHIQLEWEDTERRAFFSRLMERVTLIRYDSRGTGMSERGSLDYSIDLQMSDLEAVAERAGLERFALQGYLHMGPVAITYAAQNPERVTRLGLFCAYARGRDYVDSPQGQALGALIEKDWETYKDVAAMILSRWSPRQGAVYHNIVQQSATPDVTRAFMKAVENVDATKMLSRVQCPTLILHRQGARWPPIDIARALASNIPQARLLQLSGETAALHLDDAETVARAIQDFLCEEPDGPTRTQAGAAHGTAVILFADIVDSTALTERLGDAAFREKARDLDTSLRTIIRDAGGTPIEGKLLGDGVLATFSSARQAIEAALACGRAGDDGGLPLHLGLHAGDVIREEANVYGGAVNIAARIAAESPPGELLVSQTVRDLARTSAGVSFEDRGERQLKGIGEPVRMFEVRESR